MGIVKVRVRRQQFKVNCRDGEEEAMVRHARAVESYMDKVRSEAGVADGERAAIMAAMLLAADAKPPDKIAEKCKKQIEEIGKKIEATLVRTHGPLR